MIYTVNTTLVVNVPDNEYPNHQTAVVTDGLNEMLRGSIADVADAGDSPFILDWSYEEHPTIEGERNIVARPDLDAATYEEGDAWPEPTAYAHIFRTWLGLPPTKDEKPICGAELPDTWDFAAGDRPHCPRCEELAKQG